jgi:formimidoylglutamate deiminase
MPRLLEPTLLWDGTACRRGWRVAIDDDGVIIAVGEDLLGDAEQLHGALLPGFVNAHSHAFQFGLRGVAERFPAQSSTFWGWREAMYELVDSLDGDRCFELSRAAFTEMVAHGFTSVGEFHYVRHGTHGDFEFDEALIQAAEASGIRFVLLVACYLTGDTGKPLDGAQQRFDGGSVDAYLERLDVLAERLASPRHSLGIVAHSVRAVAIEDIVRLHQASLDRDLPFHIHLEEDPKEIESCRAVHGVTPMRLLLDNGVVSGNVVAVHCTHTDPHDMQDFVEAGGQVCLCPVTEANLGDGIADITTMRTAGASLSIGTDLNSRTDPLEELRWLEYVQRLHLERRGALVDDAGETGAALLQIGTAGGAKALGLPAGRIESGAFADFVLVDHEHPSIIAASEGDFVPALVFSGSRDAMKQVMIGGVDR